MRLDEEAGYLNDLVATPCPKSPNSEAKERKGGNGGMALWGKDRSLRNEATTELLDQCKCPLEGQ